MKTSNQKYRRRHWWKFIDWDNALMTAILVALVGVMIFGLVWVIAHPGSDDSDKTDSITDSVQVDSVAVDSMSDSTLAVDSVAVDSIPDSTLVVDSVPTKSDPAVFDTTIENTRVVIKTNRRIKVVIK